MLIFRIYFPGILLDFVNRKYTSYVHLYVSSEALRINSLLFVDEHNLYSLYFRKTRNDPGSRRRESGKSFYEKQKLLLGKTSIDDKSKTKRSLSKSNVPASSQRYTLNKNHSGSLNSLKNLGDEKNERRKLKISNKLSNGRKIRSNENLNNLSGKKGKIGRQKTLSQDSLFSSKQNQQGAIWSLESSMERSSSNSDLEDDGDSSDFEDILSR